MTMSRKQLNSKFVNNMLPEWGRFVTAVKLNRGLRDYNLMISCHAYLKQHELAHANENKMMLDRFTQHTGSTRLEVRGTMQGVQAHSKELHSDRDHKTQKYFKDKDVDDARSGEWGGIWMKRQLIFIAGGQDNVVDVCMLHCTDSVIWQISIRRSCFDEASPSYDSDILLRYRSCNYQELFVNNHEVYTRMHDDVKPNSLLTYIADYTSDSNLISVMISMYKDNATPVVQSNVYFCTNDAYMMLLNDMHEMCCPMWF
ncbi:hypothetical protein Tco_0771941 [Tanacetum coccineum]|uniref:Uncharacterized protein n=1 Tax=Tanacetum coccineum TaxID=301880 RepID=A0ABQ4ZJW8_9ASTR